MSGTASRLRAPLIITIALGCVVLATRYAAPTPDFMTSFRLAANACYRSGFAEGQIKEIAREGVPLSRAALTAIKNAERSCFVSERDLP